MSEIILYLEPSSEGMEAVEQRTEQMKHLVSQLGLANPGIHIAESLRQLEQAFKNTVNATNDFEYELKTLREYMQKINIQKKKSASSEWYRKFDKRPRI